MGYDFSDYTYVVGFYINGIPEIAFITSTGFLFFEGVDWKSGLLKLTCIKYI